jgi:hypothetical protein
VFAHVADVLPQAGLDGIEGGRRARQEGLVLRKSRRRDPRVYDHGRYWLVDASYNWLVAGGQFGLSLDEVQAALLDG